MVARILIPDKDLSVELVSPGLVWKKTFEVGGAGIYPGPRSA